jgi:polysaccharide deacetylase 2 family uncharacterized protein YibQ
MSESEIRAVLKRNLDEVGPVSGMNNHQGSKITMDREKMEIILSFCKENAVHFVDSRTTSQTVVPSVAQKLGMTIGERDAFLDNEQDRDAMYRYLLTGLERARRNGTAIMIGHTWSPELASLLAEQFGELARQGFAIKTAANILNSR